MTANHPKAQNWRTYRLSEGRIRSKGGRCLGLASRQGTDRFADDARSSPPVDQRFAGHRIWAAVREWAKGEGSKLRAPELRRWALGMARTKNGWRALGSSATRKPNFHRLKLRLHEHSHFSHRRFTEF